MYDTNEGWMKMIMVVCVFAKRKTVKYVQCGQSGERSATDLVYCKVLVLKQVYTGLMNIWVGTTKRGGRWPHNALFMKISTFKMLTNIDNINLILFPSHGLG
jgi:hypothetical protein